MSRVLTFKRARMLACVLVALYLTAWVYETAAGTPPLNAVGIPIVGDYMAFHAAGTLLREGRGGELYDAAAMREVQAELLAGRTAGFLDIFRNPPFFVLPFAALSALPLLWAFTVWSALSIASLGMALRLLLKEVPWLSKHGAGVGLLVLAFAPVYFGLIDGENATISLLLYVLIYRSLHRNREAQAGVWSALGLFKPQLFIVFPLILIARRMWRGLLAYVLTSAVLLLISVAVVGVDGMQSWMRVIIEPESANSIVNAWRMASLKSFFDLLLPGAPTLSLGMYVAASLVGIAVLLFAWVARGTTSLAGLWLLSVLVGVLVDPHLVDYDLTVLVSAGVLALSAEAPWHYRWLAAALYVSALLRPELPIGPSAVLITPLVLIIITGVVATQLLSVTRSLQATVEAEKVAP